MSRQIGGRPPSVPRRRAARTHLDVADVIGVRLKLLNLLQRVVVPHADHHVVGPGHDPLLPGNELGAADRQLRGLERLDDRLRVVVEDEGVAAVERREAPWLCRVEVDALHAIGARRHHLLEEREERERRGGGGRVVAETVISTDASPLRSSARVRAGEGTHADHGVQTKRHCRRPSRGVAVTLEPAVFCTTHHVREPQKHTREAAEASSKPRSFNTHIYRRRRAAYAVAASGAATRGCAAKKS